MRKISTGYVPRPWAVPMHARFTQRNVEVIHRRGGKTVKATNQIAHQAVRFDKFDLKTGAPFRNPQYAYVATTIGQVEKIAWPYFQYYLKDFPNVNFNQQKLRVTFDHPRGKCTIFCFGAENYDAHRGIYLDGLVLDEFADMHPDTRDKVFLPALSDRDGWELTLGTPKGDNNFKKLYMHTLARMQAGDPKYFAALKNVYDTDVFTPEQIEGLKAEMSEEAFSQEMLCDFNAAPAGYYYQRYMDDAAQKGRICSVPHNPDIPVSTYWDLGVSDSCAIWFIQEVGKEIHAIDYIEEHGRGLPHFAQELHRRPYTYNAHYLPHDILHREIGSGKPRINFLLDNGLKNVQAVPKTASVAADIEAVRQVLPKVWFDATACRKGIDALRAYQRKWDAKFGVFSDKPQHDSASHGADAFRTFGVSYQPGFGRHWGQDSNFGVPQSANMNYDILNW